jgi:hypothetical protein
MCRCCHICGNFFRNVDKQMIAWVTLHGDFYMDSHEYPQVSTYAQTRTRILIFLSDVLLLLNKTCPNVDPPLRQGLFEAATGWGHRAVSSKSLAHLGGGTWPCRWPPARPAKCLEKAWGLYRGEGAGGSLALQVPTEKVCQQKILTLGAMGGMRVECVLHQPVCKLRVTSAVL